MPVYVGCDYLRLTANDHAPFNEWQNVLLPERVAEEKAGRKRHLRWVLGYYGEVGEHYFLGRNDTGAMVSVSGTLANRMFYPLTREGGKATRVDLQVTVRPPEGQHDYLQQCYYNACLHERGRGRPAEVQIVDTNYGAKMITIGSRQSEVYGRIYDKHKESKDDFYKGMVRLEIEVKGKQAPDLHNFLKDDKLLMVHSKHITTNWFRKRGVPVFWEDDATETLPEREVRKKSDDTRLGWLASQVRPTIGKLVGNDKAVETARALLPDTASDDIVMRLAQLLCEVNGSYAG